MLKGGHPGLARRFFSDVVETNPKKWGVIANLGRAYEELERWDEAENCYDQSLKVQPDNLPALIGMASVCLHTGRHRDCVAWSDRSVAIQPTVQASLNKGFALLSLGEMREGWELYAQGVGHQQWRERKFHFIDGQPEPIWKGEADARVLVTAEQGVGDQIAFCSIIPALLERGVIIAGLECYPKLRNLLQRTFPQFPVFGTQFTDPANLGVQFTHSCTMSEMMQYADLPARPYLEVESDQVRMWDSFLPDTLKIGVAWRGGSRKSHNWRRKSADLDTFAPLFEAFPGAHFVSLEYKDPGDLSGTPLHHYQWATQTDDYENTAALVKNLDAIVTVPTSVNHLAGALGVPTYCLTSSDPHFHYGAGMPYYSSVNLYGRDDMPKLVADLQRSVYAA